MMNSVFPISDVYKRQVYGRIDIAINNAGIVGDSKKIEDLTDDDWFSVVNANLNAMFYCIREEVKYMMKNENGGSIVNTASVAGIRATPAGPAYVASKHGVVGLTKSTAMDYACLLYTSHTFLLGYDRVLVTHLL